jgi:GTP-binding protein
MKKQGIVPEPVEPSATEPARLPRVLVGAKFVTGVASRAQLPAAEVPEIAFAGRSNAGKSSAINALANRTRLAFASRTPGRTREINLFELARGGRVADLPGYGYAAVARGVKEGWQAFLWDYVTTRSTLVGLVLVADARHGLRELDYTLLDRFIPSGRPVLVLATKSDKLNQSAQRDAARRIREQIAGRYPLHAATVTVVPFSATRRTGIDAADAVLAEWLGIA